MEKGKIKTPKFDAALDKILGGLSPHKRTCKECAKEFDVFAEDIDFYKMLRVPPPMLCPLCRAQRRLGHRAYFLPVFYKKTCAAPGHTEKVVSSYADPNPIHAYDDTYYYSDEWDALSFGMDYDLSRPFFEQWDAFAKKVPHPALPRDVKSEGTEYTVSGWASKNCYYVSVPYHAEDVYYGHLPFQTKNAVDVCNVDHSESCYASVGLDRCHNLSFCYESTDCMESAFLYDCKNCSNCFGCTNLRNKQYCFFNEQLTKEEYERRMAGINLGKRSEARLWQKQFAEIYKNAIRKCVVNVRTENSLGDDLRECKNCYMSFRAGGNSENIRYVAPCDRMTNAMDSIGAQSSFLYEVAGAVQTEDARFVLVHRIGRGVEYSAECINCDYVFGCAGLRNKKFCIFNKQYTENEYWKRVDDMKTDMLARGEYGEFFPLTMSVIAYQDSSAAIDYPLSEEEVARRGWHVREKESSRTDLSSVDVLKAKDVPDDIADVSDEILKTPILCGRTGKPFRITPFELGFYRAHKLPIPTIHPLERIKDLFAFRRPFRLFQYACSKCGKDMHTSFDPAFGYKVYCKQCYSAEVA